MWAGVSAIFGDFSKQAMQFGSGADILGQLGGASLGAGPQLGFRAPTENLEGEFADRHRLPDAVTPNVISYGSKVGAQDGEAVG